MSKEHEQRYSHYCLRCGYEWYSKMIEPRCCANCKSAYWQTEKRKKTNLVI